jgi:uncharacterized protein YwqG
MSFFKSLEDLQNHLWALKAEPSFARYLTETARPALRFVRHEQRDAEISFGISKIGGEPDLPPGMEWPMRPAFPDAEERRAQLLRRADDSAQREIRAGVQYSAKLSQEAALVGQPFPLPFICQIDLSSLSNHGAFFHPLMPREGRLLVFMETMHGWGNTWTDQIAKRVIWDPSPAALLRRCATPDPISCWYEAFRNPWDAPRWADLTSAEFLEPFPVYTVSRRWGNDYQEDHPVRLAFKVCYYKLMLSSRGCEHPTGRDFGDQLGGWPEPPWGDPEDEAQLAARDFCLHSADLSRKGPDLLDSAQEWQLVLTISTDHSSTTRIFFNEMDHTLIYILMREEDLKAGRFENAWIVAQED